MIMSMLCPKRADAHFAMMRKLIFAAIAGLILSGRAYALNKFERPLLSNCNFSDNSAAQLHTGDRQKQNPLLTETIHVIPNPYTSVEGWMRAGAYLDVVSTKANKTSLIVKKALVVNSYRANCTGGNPTLFWTYELWATPEDAANYRNLERNIENHFSLTLTSFDEAGEGRE